MSRILDHAQRLTPLRSVSALASCLAAAALVAGCGGGDRVKSFQPTQIIAFGDESSAFDDTAAGTTPLVSFNGLQQRQNPSNAQDLTLIAVATADVPYRARYTVNVVADAGFFCKTQSPDQYTTAGCASLNAPTSEALASGDSTSASFFVPQSSVFGYRTNGGLPIVNQVDTGNFNDATTPLTIYRSTDHVYYCSTDFGGDYGNWVQLLASGLGGSSLGLKTGGCPQDIGNGISYAKWGAKVDDVGAQVNANLGVLRNGVLVTMLAGQNDIMAAFDTVQATPSTQDAQLKLMRDKGAQLAGIINTIVGTGARVVYLTVPDMGVSPKAVLAGNPTLATVLTRAFNEGYKGNGENKESGGLVLSVINDGHKIVKVDGYTQVEALAVTYPAVFACDTDVDRVTMPNGATVASVLGAAPSDTTSVAYATYLSNKAKALLLNCRSNNLNIISGNLSAMPPVDEVRGYYNNYLWADDQRLAPLGHASLANLAVARIRDQL